MSQGDERATGAVADHQVGPNPEEVDLSHDETFYPQGDGIAAAGDLKGPGEGEPPAEVPLPAGSDRHASVPSREQLGERW